MSTIGPLATGVTAAWRAWLPEGVQAGGGVPWLPPTALDHLGDPDGERVALLRGEPVIVPRVAAGHLRLTGEDRADFLHGQISHDVRGLPVDGVVDALLLDHRGQVRAGLSAYRRAQDLYLRVDDGQAPTVLQALREHIVFDQVEVSDLSEKLVTISLVFGDPEAAGALLRALTDPVGDGGSSAQEVTGTLLAAPPDRSLTLPWGDAGLLARRWKLGHLQVVDISMLVGQLPAVGAALLAAGGRPVGERAWTAARAAHGLPTAWAEGRLGLPQETGLEQRVSYRKGCYLGQEIMARVEARGRLRRGLVSLHLESAPPGLGLSQGWRLQDGAGKEVGRLGSAAPAPDGDGWRALAVLRLDHPPEEAMTVVPEAGPDLGDPSTIARRWP